MDSQPPAADIDERALVDSARHDPDAFAELYRRYVERIHAFAYRRTGSVHVAEDVTSATFEKALRGLDRYRWREPGIGPWLFRIASNELVDVGRRAGRDRRREEAVRDAVRVEAEIGSLEFEDLDEVRRALDDLRPRYQQAITLRYLAGLSNEEAARAMGIARGTMAVVLHRGLAALRRSLERLDQAEGGTQ